MGQFINGAIWSSVLITMVNVLDQNVPNSLGYWLDLYSPF